MHPRVCLHQVGFLSEPTAQFVAFCRDAGVAHMTLVNPLFLPEEIAGPDRHVPVAGVGTPGPAASTIVQPFAQFPDLERDEGEAARAMNAAIDIAADFGARHLYMLTGARGSLDWEAAARRFDALLAPCRTHAATRDVALSVEPANLFNADLTIAHTLDDTIRLAELAGIGVTLDLVSIWHESDLAAKFDRAVPLTRLVQVSDYVPGDRSTPCRAVPGDGAVPLERLIGQVLERGYEGVFDLELSGPRIAAEGHRAAFARAAEALSEILDRLGA